MTPLSREILEQRRQENREARRAADPAETPDVRKGKRSTAAPRLATRKAPFAGVTFTVSYKHLVPDNQKYMATARGGKARLFLTPHYREAKDGIQAVARIAMRGQEVYGGPVELHAKLYVPDERRRDATNLAKICHDAMNSTVLEDDVQIKLAVWENCGVDREHPRCEITIRPLNTKHGAAA